ASASATSRRSVTGSSPRCRRGKKQVAEGALLVAADETGISQVPPVVRTWAPRGKTPVVRHAFNWKKLSLLLLATPCGLLLRAIVAGAFRSGRILTNLKALVEVFKDRRIVVLWDGAPIHRRDRKSTRLTPVT